jgi:hypothetical protein
MYVMRFRPGNPGVGAPDVYDAPLAYAVPYSWGALYVTQEAEVQYGLNPIVPEIRDEVTTFAERRKIGITIEDERDGVHLLLAASTEYGGEKNPAATTVHPVNCKDAIELITTSGVNQDENELTIASELTQFAAHHEVEPEDMVFVTDAGEITYDMLKPLYAVHNMARKLGYPMANSASIQLRERLRDRDNKQVLSDLRRIGFISVGGLVVADTGTFGLSGGEFSHIPYVSALFIGMGAVKGYGRVKQHFQTSGLRERTYAGCASRAADMMSRDLHQTFCNNDMVAGFGDD